jgi:hypothetical protein
MIIMQCTICFHAFLITVCVPCGMTLRKTWWQKAFAPKVEQLPQLNPLFGDFAFLGISK